MLQLRYVAFFGGYSGTKGGTITEGVTGLGPQLILEGVVGAGLLMLILFGEGVAEAASHLTFKAANGNGNYARRQAGTAPWTRLPRRGPGELPGGISVDVA